MYNIICFENVLWSVLTEMCKNIQMWKKCITIGVTVQAADKCAENHAYANLPEAVKPAVSVAAEA